MSKTRGLEAIKTASAGGWRERGEGHAAKRKGLGVKCGEPAKDEQGGSLKRQGKAWSGRRTGIKEKGKGEGRGQKNQRTRMRTLKQCPIKCRFLNTWE